MHLLDELRRLSEVKAVHGNVDSSEPKAAPRAKETIEIEGRRLGIAHGSGTPLGIEEKTGRMFESERIGVIVYGSSHQSQSRVVNDILFINPGNEADSFGIITLDGGVNRQVVISG